jgi:hypothetical protein
MRMRFHLQAFSASLKALLARRPLDKLRDSDLQPAAKSLFARKPFRSDRAERKAGPGHRLIRVYVSNQPPLCWVSRSEELILSRCEVPSLTITADPNQSVALSGGDRTNWCLRYRAASGGKSDLQAREHLQRLSIARLGCTVSLKAPPLTDGLQQSASLVVDAPADAPVVVHGSFSCVSIQDMAGPVRVTATHARATILDTTGQVDATAFVMDFAGSRGRVSLTAEAEINLQMRAVRFEGDLLAWAEVYAARGCRAISRIGEYVQAIVEFLPPYLRVQTRAAHKILRSIHHCLKRRHESRWNEHPDRTLRPS